MKSTDNENLKSTTEDAAHSEYVAGFLFDDKLTEVVLIQKLRPAWQCGLFNAVGGHIEPKETPIIAMVREFQEETGLQVFPWRKFALLRTEGGLIHWFWATLDRATVRTVYSKTDEYIHIAPVTAVLLGTTGPKCMVNLNWLIGMALNGARGIDYCEAFTITEHIDREIMGKEKS